MAYDGDINAWQPPKPEKPDKCSACQGWGYLRYFGFGCRPGGTVVSRGPCWTCDGTGEAPGKK